MDFNFGLGRSPIRYGCPFLFLLLASQACFRYIEQIMIESDRDRLIREYAARKITWRELRERGFEDYIEVLGALGERGLRPPVAPMDGPNVAAHERGRAAIREALRAER